MQDTPVVVRIKPATPQTQLATSEVARYIYLRAGQVPVIVDQPPSGGAQIVLGLDKALGPESFAIKTVGPITRITGGEPVGLLYGVYRYAELLGVRFYLHGDVIPDERLTKLSVVNDTGKPLFERRGFNPWGGHAEGLDAWNAYAWKSVVAQMVKMRMNTVLVHAYAWKPRFGLANLKMSIRMER